MFARIRASFGVLLDDVLKTDKWRLFLVAPEKHRALSWLHAQRRMASQLLQNVDAFPDAPVSDMSLARWPATDVQQETVPNCTVYAYGLPPNPYWTLDPGDMVLRFRHQNAEIYDAVQALHASGAAWTPRGIRLLLEFDGLQPLGLDGLELLRPKSHIAAAWFLPGGGYHLARLGSDGWSGKPGVNAVEMMTIRSAEELLTYHGDGDTYILLGFYVVDPARITSHTPLGLSEFAQKEAKLLNKK